MTTRQIVLGSGSYYRKQLLQRLQLPFEVCSPGIDETAHANETPQALVLRLAEAKARAVAKQFPHALIIGSDQIAVLNDTILGKPGNAARAIEQLQQCSGHTVTFKTSLCLLDAEKNTAQIDYSDFKVVFRDLSMQQIKSYVKKEQPFDSAGSFKAESLGITLFEKMQGNDPSSLIGLPLIRLTSMLQEAGVDVL